MFGNLCFAKNKLFEKYGVEFHTYEGVFSKLHDHSGYWELFIITQGSVFHRFPQQSATLNRNYVQLMRPDDVHCFSPVQTPTAHISVSFEKNVMKNLLDIIDIELYQKLINYNGAVCAQISDDERTDIENRISSFKTVPEQENGYVSSQIKFIFFAILQKICANIFRENTGYPDVVREAINLMQSRYADYLTVEDICANIGCSHINLLRKFKQSTGTTVINYFLGIKLEKAFTLLISTNYKIIEICSMVGIDSISYFNKKFKEKYGFTPTAVKNSKPKDV